MQGINLKQELEQAQISREQDSVLNQALAILNMDAVHEQSIARSIAKRSTKKTSGNLLMLDHSQMFDMETIESICIKYRLRFLDSSRYKGEIPVEAVRAAKRIESDSGIQFSNFRIIAPAERFELLDSTKDPILLAELPNGKFYYIYEWGNDMSWYEYLLKFPFRHIGTLTIASIIFGALITAIVPVQFTDWKAEFFYRFFMFSMSSALMVMMVIITGIMYSKDFSENVWNSRFFK
ncbi:MAG: hypothetical protein R2813_05335 [Flavobacteriales bacterium]